MKYMAWKSSSGLPSSGLKPRPSSHPGRTYASLAARSIFANTLRCLPTAHGGASMTYSLYCSDEPTQSKKMPDICRVVLRARSTASGSMFAIPGTAMPLRRPWATRNRGAGATKGMRVSRAAVRDRQVGVAFCPPARQRRDRYDALAYLIRRQALPEGSAVPRRAVTSGRLAPRSAPWLSRSSPRVSRTLDHRACQPAQP
jgi:hypothetical protein